MIDSVGEPEKIPIVGQHDEISFPADREYAPIITPLTEPLLGLTDGEAFRSEDGGEHSRDVFVRDIRRPIYDVAPDFCSLRPASSLSKSS